MRSAPFFYGNIALRQVVRAPSPVEYGPSPFIEKAGTGEAGFANRRAPC